MKTVTLGITTYGGTHLLETCLSSVQKSVFDCGYSNVDVVVVDDGSPKLEARKLRRISRKYGAKHFRGRRNLGNVARDNTIVEKSDGNIIVLLDNDVVIPDQWFRSILHFLSNNKCGVASYLSKKVTEEQVHELLHKRRITAIGGGRVPERATELASYAYGFTRESYELVGGFDSENFKYFTGDSDFCCRLAQHGLMSYRLLYPIVYHREHSTFDTYLELQARERMKQDINNFVKKWGATSKEVEEKFLGEIKPQKITWCANYSVYYDWDVEGVQALRPRVRFMDYKQVPPEFRG